MGKILIGVITFLLITFWIEPSFVSWLVNLLPPSVNEWKTFLKVIFWIITFCSGFGISLLISVIFGAFIGYLIDGK
jgi:hypothetical protein